MFPEQHLSLVGQSVGQHRGAEPQDKSHVLYIPTREPGGQRGSEGERDRGREGQRK